MTPFAIVISWDDRIVTTREAVGLLRPVLQRCSDGSTSVSVPGAAVAVGLRAVVPGEDLGAGVLVDGERRRLIVGDIRLYGRADLVRKLGVGAVGDPDIKLIALTIDRFGDDAAAHLVGDFAFVVWDWGVRKLWAARDHFGLRSLHYRASNRGITFATDVRQILMVDSPEGHIDPVIDQDMALNYLLNDRGHRSRTYFRGIRQVRPGHQVSAGDGWFQEGRYWSPPRTLIQKVSYEDYVEEWRDLFLRAVQDRLSSAYPIAAHLSGGLDSGSIVGAAHSFYEATTVQEQQPFVTLSALFPGLACDETPYVDAVQQRTPLFESVRWNGCAHDATDFDTPVIPTPGLTRGPRMGPWGDINAARDRGARVLLMGEGGDEVGSSRGIFQEMVRHGKFWTLARELAALPSWRRRGRWFREALRGLVPWSVSDALRDNVWIPGSAPDWLGPQLAAVFPGSSEEDKPEAFPFSSQVQRELWRIFSSPRAYSAFEVLVPVAADAGLEVRTPFLDIRLVNYVLAIPWSFRMPHGDMRRLERDGVRRFLPPMVTDRLVKPVFAAAIHNQIRLNMSRIRDIVHGSVWVSAPFVRQRGARLLLAECVARDPEISHWRPWRQVWKLAAFEAWLRAVLAYSAS